MVSDGMGLANVTAARTFKNGPDGEPLSFENLRHIGYQRTHSANSMITDSAAAASAWSCGEKFSNGEICFHSDGRPHKQSILERAKKKGKSTGLVATSTITNATPAAFGAHVPSRRCEQEVARQYLMVTRVDLLLGGGAERFDSYNEDRCGTKGNFLPMAREKGYAIVHGKSDLFTKVSGGARRVLGLFSPAWMKPHHLRAPDTDEPTLAEMTTVALQVLEKDRDGFFLMVEGSQVDMANHANDMPYQIGEVLAFDAAVSVVRKWIAADPGRRRSSLLIVVADHDTGGFAVKGPKGSLPARGESVEGAWTGKDHTGVDTIIWSDGPGSENLAKSLDNTDLYDIILKVMK
jgi:alkaline phosphatase